jgi:GNAT superfamily N-acetyltransferase
MVREWDPVTAPSAEIESMVRALNSMLATDLPDDPPWLTDSFREYLGVTMPGERRITWIAEPEPGAAASRRPTGNCILGSATVLLFDDMAVLEIMVHPRARRAHVGLELLRSAVRRVYREGLTSIGVEVIGGTPAIGFYEATGFTWVYTETRSILDLSTVDWLRLGEMASGVGAGYRIEYHPGGPPEELYESYAAAKYQGINEIGLGDLSLRPSSTNAQRLRASLDTLHMRGMKPYIVVGIHESTGKVAGLTEVIVAAQHPDRADQYDTIVVEAHRGYGLTRALKARMLFEIRSAEPRVKSVQTWNPLDAGGMLAVNSELGFVADREWREYQADVRELAWRLRVAG